MVVSHPRSPAAIVPASCLSPSGKGWDGEFWAEQPFPCGQGFGVGGGGRHSWPAGAGGRLWGMQPGPGQCVSAKWNPHGPIFKAICKAEPFLCLRPRTPHLWPQPGKMCAGRAPRPLAAAEVSRQLFRIEPPRNQPVWPVTNLMLELASAWVVRSEDIGMYWIQISPTPVCHVA